MNDTTTPEQNDIQQLIESFDPTTMQSPHLAEESVLLLRFLALSATDYEGHAELKRDVRELLTRRKVQANVATKIECDARELLTKRKFNAALLANVATKIEIAP